MLIRFSNKKSFLFLDGFEVMPDESSVVWDFLFESLATPLAAARSFILPISLSFSSPSSISFPSPFARFVPTPSGASWIESLWTSPLRSCDEDGDFEHGIAFTF